MKTATCKKCKRVFSKPTQTSADQALRMHMMVKHTRRTKKPVLHRKSKKRAVEVMVNFCPNCGCNLHAVAMGIAMAGGKS